MSSLEPILELEWRRESRSGQVGTPLRVGLQQLATLSEFSLSSYLWDQYLAQIKKVS
jgi:hypothetical protein